MAVWWGFTKVKSKESPQKTNPSKSALFRSSRRFWWCVCNKKLQNAQKGWPFSFIIMVQWKMTLKKKETNIGDTSIFHWTTTVGGRFLWDVQVSTLLTKNMFCRNSFDLSNRNFWETSKVHPLREANIFAPGHGWLEDDPFLLRPSSYFQGYTYVSSRWGAPFWKNSFLRCGRFLW